MSEYKELSCLAYDLRKKVVEMVVSGKGGHIGGDMSVIDVLVALYFKEMNISPKNMDDQDRDRFVMSKGHSVEAYYAVLAAKGFFPMEEVIEKFSKFGSPYIGHPNNILPGIEMNSGSLGHGLPIAVGTALAARVLGKDYKTYCILGDGECDEGSNWEAAMSASTFKVTNMISFVDRNKCMIDGRTEDVMKLEPFADKWRSFGFIVKEVDGHNFKELCDAIDFALENKTDSPVMIIADTIKGAGINFMEDNYQWHYGAIDEEKYKKAIDSLDAYYEARKARAEKEGE